jgi:hypothetical protein
MWSINNRSINNMMKYVLNFRYCLHMSAKKSGLIVAGILAVTMCAGTTGISALDTKQRAPYDPGRKVMQPQLFAEGIISTDADEAGGVFSPDGNDCYFTIFAPYTTAPRFGMICVSHYRDGRWQKPETVSFSGKYMDFAPRLSADGSKLFFTSVRPAPGSKAPRYRIWMSEKAGDTWGEPTPLPEPINQETSHNLDASVTTEGDLYFASNRNDPAGHFHIFHSRRAGGEFQEPVKLGPEVNSDFSESAPAVSPDGKLLVFASNAAPEDPARRRPQDLIAAGKPYPRQDLYISVNRDGHWTSARHLEHGINSFAEEVYPSFTPDGKYLFWGSERSGFEIPTPRLTRTLVEKRWLSPRNGRGNIYFISVEALEVEK